MISTIQRIVLRPAMLGAVLVTLLAFAAPVAMAAPIGGEPPIPDPPIPTPMPPPDYAPDLVVESFSYGSINTGYGKYYYVDAKIRNQGNRPAGEFWVKNDAGIVGAYRQIYGLDAGSFINVRFYRTSCESRGTIIADVYGQVSEYSETNNRRDWLLIC